MIKRMQDREERGTIWQRCARPTCTLHYCDGHLCTGYSAVPNAHIRRDTQSGANRHGCVSRSKGHPPDNTDSGTRGTHGRRMVASQNATHWFIIFGVGVSCSSMCSSICLSVAVSGLTPCTCCVMRRSDVCLYNLIVSHRPNKPVDFNL